MKLGILIRLAACILCFAYFLYAYLVWQNTITELRLQIPALNQEVQQIEERNIGYQFAIDTFESPDHLLELSRSPEYKHLKHPLSKDILVIPVPKSEKAD